MAWKRSHWISAATALVLAGSLALANGAAAQNAADASAADASLQALTSSREATLARRMVMNSIGTNNDALHDMLDGVLPFDAFEFQARLFSMYALFEAFPSLYRAEPNPWTQEREDADPAHVSLALPSVWDDWEGFVALNAQAAETTQRASFTSQEGMLAVVEELEQQCEACHVAYRRSFDDFRDFQDLPYPEGTTPPAAAQ